MGDGSRTSWENIPPLVYRIRDLVEKLVYIVCIEKHALKPLFAYFSLHCALDPFLSIWEGIIGGWMLICDLERYHSLVPSIMVF